MYKTIILPLVLALLSVAMASEVCGQRARGNGRGPGPLAGENNRQTAGNALTVQEREDLILLREEEKLARDVYLAMHEKWGQRVFSNIAQAETQHMAAVANLLSRYAVADPVQDKAPGKFASLRFQKLYETLVDAGSTSLSDALQVGLKIEEMDIADLRTAIQRTNNQDITRVFENLQRASRNHLRAFARRLAAAGDTYVATHLSQTEFDQIASSPQERGGVGAGPAGQRGKGRGKRKGKGRGNNNRR